jgi:hypothetical protein
MYTLTPPHFAFAFNLVTPKELLFSLSLLLNLRLLRRSRSRSLIRRCHRLFKLLHGRNTMRPKTIWRHISPPRRAIQRLRNCPIENHERIIRAANLHLRLRRRTLPRLSSCGIRIPHARLPVGILHTHTHPIVCRVDRPRSIVLHRIADRRIHQSPMSSANHDDQVCFLRIYHTLKPSPVHQRRFNVMLGHAVCLRIFRINTRAGVNDDRDSVCLQNIRRKRFVLALGQRRNPCQQPKREYCGNSSQHRDPPCSAQILR